MNHEDSLLLSSLRSGTRRGSGRRIRVHRLSDAARATLDDFVAVLHARLGGTAAEESWVRCEVYDLLGVDPR